MACEDFAVPAVPADFCISARAAFADLAANTCTEHGKTVSSESSESIDACSLGRLELGITGTCIGIGAGETAEKPTASV